MLEESLAMPPTAAEVFGSSDDDEAGAPVARAAATTFPVPHPWKRLEKLDRILEGLVAQVSRDGVSTGFKDLVGALDQVRALLKTLWSDDVDAADKLETLNAKTTWLAEGTITRLIREREEQDEYLDRTIRVGELAVEKERWKLASITGRMNEAIENKKRGRFEFEGVVVDDDDAN